MSNVRKSGTFPLSLCAKARLFLYHFVLSRLFNLIVRGKRDQARRLPQLSHKAYARSYQGLLHREGLGKIHSDQQIVKAMLNICFQSFADEKFWCRIKVWATKAIRAKGKKLLSRCSHISNIPGSCQKTVNVRLNAVSNVPLPNVALNTGKSTIVKLYINVITLHLS